MAVVQRMPEEGAPSDRLENPHSPEPEAEAIFDDVPSELLLNEIASLERAISQEADPAYDRLYEQGRYEVVGYIQSGEEYPIPVDNSVLSSYRFMPPGEVWRVILSQEEYPELYDLRAQANRIRHVLKSRRPSQQE